MSLPTDIVGNESEETPVVEILEALWRALQDNYPMLEYMGARGEAWLNEFRPRVAAAPTQEAAFMLMDELVCRLNDYHTRFSWPGQPQWEVPPVRLEPVWADQPAIDPIQHERWGTGPARAPAAEQGLGTGFRPFSPHHLACLPPPPVVIAVVEAPPDCILHPGDEVVSVESVPVRVALEQAWKHSVGSSPVARLREASWRMLLGPTDQPVEIGVRFEPQAQSVRTVRLPRSGRPEEPALALHEVRGIPIIRIVRWANLPGEDLVRDFDRMLERYRDCPGLIFDVRENGGGLDSLADQITGRFLSEPVISSLCFRRLVPSLTFERTIEWAQPRGPWRYEGRIAVLTSEGSLSACEHFVSGMAEAEALLCGTPTNGACGLSRNVALPGGASVTVSKVLPLHTGGLPSPLLGIVPHCWRPRTLSDLLAGRDAALETALEWVTGAGPRIKAQK